MEETTEYTISVPKELWVKFKIKAPKIDETTGVEIPYNLTIVELIKKYVEEE